MSTTTTNADVQTAAQLSLGIIAYQLRDLEPQRSRAIADETLQQLAQATDFAEKVDALAVLGNTGDIRALQAIEPLFADTNELLRQRACTTLRRVRTPQAIAAIFKAMTTDASAGVRSECAESLSPQVQTRK